MKDLTDYLIQNTVGMNYIHTWDIGFGSGQVTELLAKFSGVVIAVEIDAGYARPMPGNIIPIIGSVQSLVRAIMPKAISLVHIDVGNNQEACRYVLQQLKEKAQVFLLKNYPWLPEMLANNETPLECIPVGSDYTEVRWMK